ncbi:MAG: IS30 family transposase [Bacilli bacterium]
MTNYNQLCEEQRETIQMFINKNESFTAIGNAIKVDRTTVSREIKRNRYIKSYYYDAFDKKGIDEAVSKCDRLKRPPYVCNNCPLKNKCSKHHLYYNSNLANKHANEVLSVSRTGVDISPETIEEIENSIVPLIKDKKQSVNQVYINHPDILYFSKTTFYRYVNDGIFSLINADLPKKVKYKPRKHKKDKSNKRELALLIGRKYEDFLQFIANHPNMNIVEMDTVIGTRSQGKVLLTLYLRKTHFMLIFLLDKKNVKCVNDKITYLKNTLGIKLYSKVFRIFLTDNGAEFFDPLNFEIDYDKNRKVCNLFYCNSYSSYQKHGVEVNHEYIRRVFPKGTSFKNLNDDIVKRLQDNINAIPRDSLNGETPYNLTIKKYPDLISKLNCSYINPDDVDMSIKNILGDQHEK